MDCRKRCVIVHLGPINIEQLEDASAQYAQLTQAYQTVQEANQQLKDEVTVALMLKAEAEEKYDELVEEKEEEARRDEERARQRVCSLYCFYYEFAPIYILSQAQLMSQRRRSL